MFKIQKFMADISKRGILRNNRFEIIIETPEYLRSKYTSDDVSIRCESIQFPGMAFLTADVMPRPGYGAVESNPYSVQFDDISATFLVDANSNVHKFFYLWTNAIVNYNALGQNYYKDSVIIPGSKTYEVGYKDKFASKALTIRVYDLNERVVMEAVAYRAFPRVMPSFDLSWAADNDMVKLNMQFTYTDFNVKYNPLPAREPTFKVNTIEGEGTSSPSPQPAAASPLIGPRD